MNPFTITLPGRLCAVLCLGWAMVASSLAQTPRKQDWVGVWTLGEKRIVITAPDDGAADAIVIRAYPKVLGPQADAGNAPVVTLQGFDADPGHPIDTDRQHRIRMRLDGSQLRVEQERSSSPGVHDLSGVYGRSASPLAWLWAEKPAWVRFSCDCDVERMRRSVLDQLDRGHAVGREGDEPDNTHLVLDTLDAPTSTVLVVTHSHDGVCAKDSFRIVSRSGDGRWRGEVARWLGLAAQPGGIQDRFLWKLTAREQQQLAGLESADASVVPRFWWDHEQRTLKVGMEACIVLPDDASAGARDRAQRLDAFAARFKPRTYRALPAATSR
jgi:hypothetical protein